MIPQKSPPLERAGFFFPMIEQQSSAPSGQVFYRLAGLLSGFSGWRRGFTAFLLGAFVVLALPPVHFVAALVPGFVCLVWLLDGTKTFRQAFALGWWFGFGFFVAGLYWVTEAFLVDAERFGWMAPFALAFGAGALALETGLALGLCRLLWRRGSVFRIFLLTAIWTGAEMLRGAAFTGFPWNLIGSVWTQWGEPLQAAAIIGVFGLSYVSVFAAAAPALLGDQPSLRSAGSFRLVMAASFIILPLMLVAYGSDRLPDGRSNVSFADLRLVQPDIKQADKWKYDRRTGHVAKQIRMGLQGPDPAQPKMLGEKGVIIWAETAVPFGLPLQADVLSALGRSVPKGATMIVGAPRPVRTTEQPRPVYNSAFIISDGGSIQDTYDKHHLVPFGEYLPFRDILRPLGLERLAQGHGDFQPGPGPRTLALNGLPPVSILICYEIIFSGRVVDPDNRPAWILNMTNDAWFGSSAGPYQHFAAAKLRAVEQGLPVVRVANGGISAIIDGFGREQGRLGLGVSGVLDGGLPLALEATPYSKAGSSPIIGIIIVIIVLGIFYSLLHRKKRIIIL